jgi:hypothetical protein
MYINIILLFLTINTIDPSALQEIEILMENQNEDFKKEAGQETKKRIIMICFGFNIFISLLCFFPYQDSQQRKKQIIREQQSDEKKKLER